MTNRKTSPRPHDAVSLAGELHLGSYSLIFDDDEVIQLLRAAVEREGNQGDFCEASRHQPQPPQYDFERKKRGDWHCCEGSSSSESLLSALRRRVLANSFKASAPRLAVVSPPWLFSLSTQLLWHFDTAERAPSTAS
jgi:hypothetical protein